MTSVGMYPQLTHHGKTQKLSGEEIIIPLLQVIQIVLETGVRVRVAVGKLVHFILIVKVEGKGHDVVLPMVWAAVVVNILCWYSHPVKKNKKT